jgi:hypothetical protein
VQTRHRRYATEQVRGPVATAGWHSEPHVAALLHDAIVYVPSAGGVTCCNIMARCRAGWNAEDTLKENYVANQLVVDPNEGFGRNNKALPLRSKEEREARGEPTHSDDDGAMSPVTSCHASCPSSMWRQPESLLGTPHPGFLGGRGLQLGTPHPGFLGGRGWSCAPPILDRQPQFCILHRDGASP